MIEIREATSQDEAALWEIFSQVVAAGESYVFPMDSDFEVFQQNWMKYSPLVAIEEELVVGTYIIKPNQMGLGAHIANGSFMVHPKHEGKGLGKKLGLHALRLAKSRGFKAMQFNMVVATNEAAVALWTKLGFEIIGTVPGVFKHKRLGYVDAYVMYQNLEKDTFA